MNEEEKQQADRLFSACHDMFPDDREEYLAQHGKDFSPKIVRVVRVACGDIVVPYPDFMSLPIFTAEWREVLVATGVEEREEE